MVDAGWGNFVFLFSRTQENAFLDAFSRKCVSVPQMYFVQQRSGGAIAPIPGCLGPDVNAKFRRLLLLLL